MPMCSDGVNDMFEAQDWDIAAVTMDCQVRYGLTPRPRWVLQQYGGKNISAHSNIIFRQVIAMHLSEGWTWIQPCK